ncbi:MAG: hypothetical protein HYZ01_13925 [Ignavibacteriales bacterium]|nr:hypothetical protein [Ignavibacteriales bacterium]
MKRETLTDVHQVTDGTAQPDLTVSTLIEQCRSGDVSAFQKIMEMHQQADWRILYLPSMLLTDPERTNTG